MTATATATIQQIRSEIKRLTQDLDRDLCLLDNPYDLAMLETYQLKSFYWDYSGKVDYRSKAFLSALLDHIKSLQVTTEPIEEEEEENDPIVFYIPLQYLPMLENGDLTGSSDEQDQNLVEFLDTVTRMVDESEFSHYTLDYDPENITEPYRNDLDLYKNVECVAATLNLF
jgi:hypothetical protein